MAEPASRFAVVVGSPPERRDLSVEVYIDGEQWGEVHDDPGHIVTEFFGRANGKAWVLTAAEAQELIRRACAELEARPRREP
jgi:hypothetical protein